MSFREEYAHLIFQLISEYKNSLLTLPLLVLSASLHLPISSFMHIYFIYLSVYTGAIGARVE